MSEDEVVKRDDGPDGDKPVDELTAGVMVQDYLREKHPKGHAFITEEDGEVQVHGIKHDVNERIVSRLASGKFSVRADNLATPKRRQVASWLERQVLALTHGNMREYHRLKEAERLSKPTRRRRAKR